MKAARRLGGVHDFEWRKEGKNEDHNPDRLLLEWPGLL